MKSGSRIRRRSVANSRNHENKALIAEYRAANPLCELHRFPLVPGGRLGVEINHLFSQRKRWDLISNIIHLSVPAHRWFHDFPIDGRVMCLWVKALKHEIAEYEIKQASGMFLAGWLASKEPTLEWVKPYHTKLVTLFS